MDAETIFWTRDIAQAAASPHAGVVCLNLDDPALQSLTLLPPTPDDVARAAVYGAPQRERFFARRAMLRQLIALRLGCVPETIGIANAASGAPRLMAPAHSGLYLSVSGRGAFAGLAIASRPIGVDIEILGSPVDVPLAMLHQNEVACFPAVDAGDRHRAFLELWTFKEAYLKALGLGLTREPADIEVQFDAEGGIRLLDRGAPVKASAAMGKVQNCGAETVIAAAVML
jgi:4'-phosphopantetheinyl transferase